MSGGGRGSPYQSRLPPLTRPGRRADHQQLVAGLNPVPLPFGERDLAVAAVDMDDHAVRDLGHGLADIVGAGDALVHHHMPAGGHEIAEEGRRVLGLHGIRQQVAADPRRGHDKVGAAQAGELDVLLVPDAGDDLRLFRQMADGQDDQNVGVVPAGVDDHRLGLIDTGLGKQFLAGGVAQQPDEAGIGRDADAVFRQIDGDDPVGWVALRHGFPGGDHAAVPEPAQSRRDLPDSDKSGPCGNPPRFSG